MTVNNSTLTLQAQYESDQFCHSSSDDFDEQAGFLNGWNQDYAQISAGSFKGFVSQIHIENVSLFWEFTSHTLYQQGHLNPENVAIGVPMNTVENGMFCGSSCKQNAIHIYSGNNGFAFISPQNLMIGLIVVNRQKLMQLLSAEDQYFLNLQCQQARVFEIAYQTYAQLVHFLKSTFQLLKAEPEMAKNTIFQEHLSANAIQLVTDCLLNNHQNSTDNALHKSWKVLSDIRELTYSHQEQPLTIAELCESLSISRRSLQYHFEQALNTSPMAYLRAERLNGVRHMLKTANSVTEAATHWGFWHFGHFSHEYKKMFGELPSMTFKRLRQLN